MGMDGKVALVTGAQQGIGRAIAVAFGRAGASLVLNYLDDEVGARSLADELATRGGRVECVSGDVTRNDDVQRMVDAGDALGGIDVLVNNAAIFPRVEFLSMSEADWDRVLDVNLKGTFRCARAVLPGMVSRARGGAVINLTSGAAFRGSPRGVHYVASKAGVVGLTRELALEMAPHGIRVNAIAPGLTDTAQPRDGMTEQELQSAGAALPLGRLGTVDDVAAMAVFLATGASSHVTGQTLHVNGGGYLA